MAGAVRVFLASSTLSALVIVWCIMGVVVPAAAAAAVVASAGAGIAVFSSAGKLVELFCMTSIRWLTTFGDAVPANERLDSCLPLGL